MLAPRKQDDNFLRLKNLLKEVADTHGEQFPVYNESEVRATFSSGCVEVFSTDADSEGQCRVS